MSLNRSLSYHFFLCVLLAGGLVQAGGVRDHTRSTQPRDTPVSETQAQVLSLALAVVTTQQLQSWVRMAGKVDDRGKNLIATSCLTDATFVEVGQRVIAFPPEAKSSINQGRVTQINAAKSCLRIEVVLAAGNHESGRFYVMEIVVLRGRFLAIPKEAIIEEEGRSLVYVQADTGHYLPRVIHLGLKGERYTQVLYGLKAGEYVVTLGSFFIHTQHQLDEHQTNELSHAHHVY